MRLINADELKKKLWSPIETYITENIVTEEEIDETPTAYDIDEVVEQLEELEKEVIYHGCEVDRIADVVEDAIEIVKKGGKL